MTRGFTPAYRGGAGPPLVLVHGFTDTWRTWELVLPALERHHEVLAPTLPGHAGGPELSQPPTSGALADAVEGAMDDAGLETAHVAGSSLGGYVALQLAERGRARSVVAFAPAGGWPAGDPGLAETLGFFRTMHAQVRSAAPFADAIASTPAGRRRATAYLTTRFEHIPAELVAHQIRGAAGCDAALPLIELAERDGYPLDADRIACPLRIVWGTADRLLPWPAAAAAHRASFPHADWVVLDDVGHSPQLDVPVEAAQLVLGLTAPSDQPS